MVRAQAKRRKQKSKEAKRSGPKHAATDFGLGELLFEIGTEELPYQFVAPALHSLKDATTQLFKAHRLTHKSVRTFGTPRRLTLAVEALSGHQLATIKEAMGPSKAVAFDAKGQPTKAAVGFAAGQGVSVADLVTRHTPKGDYVFVVKRDPGRTASAVLAELLPHLIEGLSFPKSMRWNETGVRFARPIRWILAIHGGKVIEFQVSGVRASNRTWGHRFLSTVGTRSKRGLRVTDLRSYLKVLECHGVIPEQERRRSIILAQIDGLAKSVRGQVHRDEELLEQAIYAVEYPHAILGSFNPQYLSLPKEVLMTSMKEHQGFFSIMQRDGSLLPQFISVTNMKLANMKLIREGNERVLAARLADAKFFFDEDRKVRLADRVKKLTGVIFHQKLGTLHQKQERIVKLATRLMSDLPLPPETASRCRRAAQLCKADLLTGMVGEFPMLQGIMGGAYARHDGEPEEVWKAISEQYLPRSMEGNIPQTLAGKILSLADRLDTIAAFFHVGIVPTGSEDPFALRRHATAIVRIILEGTLRFNLGKAIDNAKNIVADDGFKGASTHENDHGLAIVNFIFERLRYYGRTVHGLRNDVMDAVLAPLGESPCDLMDLLSKMIALQAITGRPEFNPLIVGFKRAHRLVEKERWSREEVEPTLFQHPAEAALHKMLETARLQVPYAIEQGDYAKALDGLVQMKPAIDSFFEEVMVNAEDEALRANRLSLLVSVDRLFMSFADFSQIAVQGI